MLLGFKTELDLNNKERSLCLQHAGTRRHAANWGLDICMEKLRAQEKIPSAIDLHKKLNAEVKPENEWYYDVSKCAPQQGLRDLQKGFDRFWNIEHPKNLKKKFKDRYHARYWKKFKKGEIENLSFEHEKGFPQFKKKGVNDKFYLDGSIEIKDGKIRLPRFGWVNMYEKCENGKVNSVTISRKADRWFVAFKVEREQVIIPNRKPTVGVDIGIKTLATLSDGKTFDNPKAYTKNKNRLARAQRKLSRQYEKCKDNKDKEGHVIYGENYKKTKKEIAELHFRMSSVRKDSTHKLTNYLVKNHDHIVIEDLNVSGMMKNHNLAGAIADGGFYEFRRQLEYKGKLYDCKITIADRFFASSKTCSECGHKQEMPLKQRTFECECCKNKLDRDLNAAVNLKNFAVSSTVDACSLSPKLHREIEVGAGTGTRPQTTTSSDAGKFV